jgi:translation initiation factor IF-3
VRVIGSNGEQIGILSIRDALQVAEREGLDLVEVSPTTEPPVCRVMDFGKYQFEINKKQQASRRRQRQVQVKEIKIRPATDENDFQVKLRNLQRFLTEGDKAKVTLRFRGRELAHQELGIQLLDRIRTELEPMAVVEQQPRLEGRQMVMVFSPRKKS